LSENPQQWQCGECAAWVDSGYSRHVHLHETAPTLDSMIEARRMLELNMPTTDPLAAGIADTSTTYWRTGKEPTRDKPL